MKNWRRPREMPHERARDFGVSFGALLNQQMAAVALEDEAEDDAKGVSALRRDDRRSRSLKLELGQSLMLAPPLGLLFKSDRLPAPVHKV